MIKSNRAFTLVELLVVIGIIGVLISVLLPVFSVVRASATNTSCQSRLRQLFQAQQLYANANRDRMAPPVYAGLPSPYASGARSWREALSLTLSTSSSRAEEIFECPGSPEGTTNTYGLNTSITMPQWNLRLSKRTDVARLQYDPARGQSPEKPFSQLILFADKGSSSDSMLRSSDGFSYISETNRYGTFNVWEQWVRHSPHGALRHRGQKANAVFMDGHVAPVRDELYVQSGYWYFGTEPEAVKLIGAGCCQ